jgi:hypothetical protein
VREGSSPEQLLQAVNTIGQLIDEYLIAHVATTSIRSRRGKRSAALGLKALVGDKELGDLETKAPADTVRGHFATLGRAVSTQTGAGGRT